MLRRKRHIELSRRKPTRIELVEPALENIGKDGFIQLASKYESLLQVLSQG